MAVIFLLPATPQAVVLELTALAVVTGGDEAKRPRISSSTVETAQLLLTAMLPRLQLSLLVSDLS